MGHANGAAPQSEGFVNLRPYQHEAIQSIASELAAGRNRLLLQLATGMGKTAVAGSVLRHESMAGWFAQFPERDRRAILFVHREEIVDSAAETFRRLNPGAMVGIEQGDRHANRYCDIVIASIQTLAAVNCRRLKDLIRFHPFRLVFCDEAHRSPSKSYRNALVHLGFLPPEDASEDEDMSVEQMTANLAQWDAKAPKDRILIGLTATPNRSDGVGLSAVFQSIAFQFPLRKGIEAGYLAPIVPWQVETATSLDAVRSNKGDFNQGDLGRTVNTPERNRLAVAGWVQKAAGRPTIAFTAGVAHAHDLAAEFTSAGIVARAVSGETPKDERRQTVEDYRQGRVTVLTNDSVFTEGTDLPITSCILMAKPTKSALLFEQAIGRGLRLSDGKKDCVLIDVVDVARKHSLMTAPCLYGLPPGLKSESGKTLEEMAEAFETFVNGHPGVNIDKMGRISIEQLAIKASTFDMWQVPSLGAFGAGRALNWIKVSADSFRIQFPWQDGVEVVAVVPDLLRKFAVSCTFRPANGPARQRTLAHGIETADLAAGIAEAYVLAERKLVTKLIGKDARWRKDPASDRQKDWLRWKKIPFNANISKGEAADLRNMVQAKEGR